MRQGRNPVFTAVAVCCVIAVSAVSMADPASAAQSQRDQASAMRMSVKWLNLYEPRFWVGVELPGACATRPGGERRCPIAITIRAWTGGALVAHRCAAEAVLPPRNAKGKPTRSSASCTPFAPAAG